MAISQRHHRQVCRSGLLTLVIAFAFAGTQKTFAASQDATLFFRPHCELITEDGDTILGPVPDVEGMVGIENSPCPRFDVEDPQTLKTIPLRPGDTLEFDVAVYNPSRQSINHVRSWIAYDTNVFEGVSVTVTPNFPLVTPGESDFDHANGYVMIEASNDVEGANTNGVVAVAQVKLRIKITPPSGTFVSFYDIQPNGHTVITTKENGNDAYILGEEPGGLHVLFAQDNVPPPTNQAPPPQDQPPSNPSLPPPSDFFQENTQNTTSSPPQEEMNPPPPGQVPPPSPPTPTETTTTNTPPLPPSPDGSACTENTDCQSNNCANGFCTAANQIPGANPSPPPPERTAFALLQVRNLRVTTEGSSVFLAWDELNSSSLQAYNIYYGTTTGRYIQRKTLDGSMKSITLRSLPVGTTYYIAIRAVSTSGEESAFSQEVAVEVGDPDSSTSPLVENAVIEVVTQNPVGDLTGNGAITVPGETGTPSTIALLLMLCALIGTTVAFRRQIVATVHSTANEQ